MSYFQVRNLSFAYNRQKKIISNFNFTAEKGDIIQVSGDSGKGKTTLLKIFCGVIPKVIKGDFSGEIIIEDKNISQLSLIQISPYVSYMMQEAEEQFIFPIVENELVFGPENLNLPIEKINKRVENALTLLQINMLRYSQTHTLSYGQKKLVAFASLLTYSPMIFLLDEPFSGLSKKYIDVVIKVIKQLSTQNKIIFVAGHSDVISNLSNKKIEL